MNKPLEAVAVRFSHQLPADNQLPYLFARQIAADDIKSPMIGDWLSSDRPPLQTAYFLMSGTSLLPESDLHYQIAATLLQSLWLVGLWLLLSVLNLGRQEIFLGLLVPMLSGFAFVHGLFTWPKLFPIIYLAGIIALFLRTDKDYLQDWRVGGVVGGAVALSMLCHGGSLFALLGMGLAFLILKRIPDWRFIVCAGFVAVSVLLAWSIYQGVVDPPGNRLLKWHLAGIETIDSRTVGQAVRQRYAQFNSRQILAFKLSNLAILYEHAMVWMPLIFKGAFAVFSDLEGGYLRGRLFFQLFAALGLLGMVLPVSMFMAYKRNRKGGLWLLLIAAAIVFSEVLLLFGPSAAFIHHGSLLLVCLAFSGAILTVIACHPLLAWLLAGTHFLLTAALYGKYLPEGLAFNYAESLWLLVPVSLGWTIVLLWQIAGESWQKSIVWDTR